MPPSEYRYPDGQDELTAVFVRDREPYPGYWDESDRLAMAQLDEALDLGAREGVRALDAGCGHGRLLPWISRRAAHVTALDPDAERLVEARRAFEQLASDTTVEFLVGDVSVLGEREFDLMLSSHVMQHVPTSVVPDMFAGFAAVAGPRAVLVVICCRAPEGRGNFSIDRLEDGRVVVEPATREQFDAACSAPAEEGVLPVRRIDPQDLYREAAAEGWRPVWTWSYHFLGIDPGGRPADERLNREGPITCDAARDMIAVFSRTAA